MRLEEVLHLLPNESPSVLQGLALVLTSSRKDHNQPVIVIVIFLIFVCISISISVGVVVVVIAAIVAPTSRRLAAAAVIVISVPLGLHVVCN